MAIDNFETAPEIDAINIYFLAAPEDEQQCIAIKKHLTPAIRRSKRPIEIESDFEIPPGQDVNEYKKKLFEAEIVLAFISSDFINDDETYMRTQKVIERHNRNETVMLPILVRNCMWKSTPFVNLPLLPKNFQPLNNKQFWNSEDDAIIAVVTDIYEAIENFSYDEGAEKPKPTTSANPPTEEEIINQPEATRAPSAGAILENEPVKEVEPKQAKTKNFNNIAMDVDWRKDYYKNVLWKRALAYFLDNLITAIPAVFLAFVFWAIVSVLINPDGADDVSDTEATFMVIFSLLFYFIICAIFESSKYKGTFGKQIMKLEITDKHGNRIGFFKAFWRNIFRVLTAYSYLLIIPLIVQIFTFMKTKKLFHDQISTTVVGEKIKR